jgi:DNA invertase Pin-like site-specific DNA recombinase
LKKDVFGMKVGYARKSREKQDLVTQINKLLSAGVDADNIFSDSESGATRAETRDGFMKMLNRISEGGIDELVVTELSRIGRDSWNTLVELGKLGEKGVKITSLSANEKNISSLPREFQPIMISAMTLGNDLERKHTRERIQWSLDEIKAGRKTTKSGKPLGRPAVNVDWKKVQDKMDEFGISANMARVLLKIKASTFYQRKAIDKPILKRRDKA